MLFHTIPRSLHFRLSGTLQNGSLSFRSPYEGILIVRKGYSVTMAPMFAHVYRNIPSSPLKKSFLSGLPLASAWR